MILVILLLLEQCFYLWRGLLQQSCSQLACMPSQIVNIFFQSWPNQPVGETRDWDVVSSHLQGWHAAYSGLAKWRMSLSEEVKCMLIDHLMA